MLEYAKTGYFSMHLPKIGSLNPRSGCHAVLTQPTCSYSSNIELMISNLHSQFYFQTTRAFAMSRFEQEHLINCDIQSLKSRCYGDVAIAMKKSIVESRKLIKIQPIKFSYQRTKFL